MNESKSAGWLAGWLVGLLDSNLQLLLFRMCLCVYLFSLSKIHYLIISGKKKKFFFLTFSLFILYSALFILIRFGFELLVDFFFFFGVFIHQNKTKKKVKSNTRNVYMTPVWKHSIVYH